MLVLWGRGKVMWGIERVLALGLVMGIRHGCDGGLAVGHMHIICLGEFWTVAEVS